MKKGFTLLEIIIITIVIGILATFALPQYAKVKEKALDDEAKGFLLTILAAEKIFKAETTDYYDFASASKLDDINDTLNLTLPPGSFSPGDGKWHYSTNFSTATDSTGATVKRICIVAKRNLTNKRCWQICNPRINSTDSDEPQEVTCGT